ncbi:MAG: site-2 protease family protein [Clostridia bacterium]|nr:site-2 protease family protein [Clostridia bacterium]
MENNLLSAWSSVYGVVLAILILLAMITIHEFGHYIAGKLLKFKINEFSIGFGPALFKRKSKKTGELFAIRLIPLGGYCAFEDEDGLNEESDKAFSLAKGETAAKKELNAAQESPFKKEEESQTASVSDGAFTKKKPWQRIVVLFAGAFMNYLLALVLILVMIGSFGQSLVMVQGSEVADSQYIGYSFEEGDILLSAEGEGFYLTTDIAHALNGKKAGTIVTFRVAREKEGGGYEEVEQEIMLRENVEIQNSTQANRVFRALGVGIRTETEIVDGEEVTNRYYMLTTASYRFGFLETIGRSFVYSFKLAGSIFRVLGELLTGKLGLDALGGPVTTITMTSQIAASGVRNFLEIAAYIGVNLAVFNLLPIPALDGSKIVFTAIEWVRGKPISRKVEAVIHAVGFVLLLGFAILVDFLQFI